MVKKSCCVDGCDADGETDGVTFHRFPSNRILKRKWIRALDLGDKVTVQTAVCCQHFKDDDFDLVRGRKKLKNNAVPKYNLNLSTSNSSDSELSNFDVNDINNRIAAMENNGDEKKNNEDDKRSDEGEDISNKNKVSTIKNEDSLKNGTKQVMENGLSHLDEDMVERNVNSILPPSKPSDPDDIEDLLTNYQIKQNDILREKLQASLKEKEALEDKPPDKNYVEVEVDFGLNPATGDPEPKFIEVPIHIDRKGNSQTDCLMVLENVQCEIDPSNLLALQEPSEDTRDSHSASDVEVEIIEKKEDPISLLTSSDEDDVILQEPKIDTVEVSSADTDEDDMPLKRLARATTPKTTEKPDPAKQSFAAISWGQHDYYCAKCNYATADVQEYSKHKAEHKSVIQICNLCDFQTASKDQLAKHKKKHKDEKLFECHFCLYRAKHKMSLVYHLNTHTNDSPDSGKKKAYSCDSCYFRSFHKNVIENHVKKCGKSKGKRKRSGRICAKIEKRERNSSRSRSSSVESDRKSKEEKRYSCRKCNFKTKRKFDLKRHIKSKHRDEDSDVTDEDFKPPPYVKCT